MTTFLVTGAGGFIGSNLTAYLARRGHRVVAFDLPRALRGHRFLTKLYVELPSRVVFCEGDVTDGAGLKRCVAEFGVGVVFHLAAVVNDWGRAEVFERVNVEGTRTLLEVCTKSATVTRVVVMSSVSVYDYFQGHHGTVEDAPVLGSGFINDYAKSKVHVENLIRRDYWSPFSSTSATASLEVCIVRPGLCPFGEEDRTSFLHLAKAISWHICPYVGFSGHHRISISYVGNLVEGLFLVGTVPEARNQVFCLADDDTPTWREFAKLVGDGLQAGAPFITIPVWLAWGLAVFLEFLFRTLRVFSPGPPLTRYRVAACTNDLVFSNAKAKAVLGWRPRVGLREGVARAVLWVVEVLLSE